MTSMGDCFYPRGRLAGLMGEGLLKERSSENFTTITPQARSGFGLQQDVLRDPGRIWHCHVTCLDLSWATTGLRADRQLTDVRFRRSRMSKLRTKPGPRVRPCPLRADGGDRFGRVGWARTGGVA